MKIISSPIFVAIYWMETRALLKLLTHKRDQIRDKLFSTFLHFILQKIWTFHDQDGLFLVTYVVLQMQIKNYVAYYHVSFVHSAYHLYLRIKTDIKFDSTAFHTQQISGKSYFKHSNLETSNGITFPFVLQTPPHTIVHGNFHTWKSS